MYGAKTLSYPESIHTIPYASFLEIERWEYSEAMEKVAKNQNDALGAVQNSNKAIKEVLNFVEGSVDKIYGAEDNLNNSVFRGDMTPEGAENFFTNDIRLDHIDVQLPGEETSTNMKALKNDKDYIKIIKSNKRLLDDLSINFSKKDKSMRIKKENIKLENISREYLWKKLIP